MGGRRTRPQCPVGPVVSHSSTRVKVRVDALPRYLNVWYRRTRRLDVPLITDIKVLPDPPAPGDMPLASDGWFEAEGNVRSGVWPTQPRAKLWYRLKDQGWDKAARAVEAPDAARQYIMEEDFITEVDILYGDGDPFFGFERSGGEKVVERNGDTWEAVDIVYRRGNPSGYCLLCHWPRPLTGQVRLKHHSPDSTQTGHSRSCRVSDSRGAHGEGRRADHVVADLHYSVGTGECKETDKEPCSGDADTEAWLIEALDAERPDLVVCRTG